MTRWRVMLPCGLPCTSAVFLSESAALFWMRKNAKAGCYVEPVKVDL